MDVLSNEKYLIARAKESTDPYKAKAWIIAAKTLFPNDFGVQFEAYEIEKNANNFEEAAKCLSYIVMTFHGAHQTPTSLLNEISLMTNALRIPEGCTTPEQEFYVKMFQYISYEVQHQILLLTAAHSNNNLDHCRLILLLLKRFPQAISTHAPRLLETLIQNVAIPSFKEMLFNEAIPLVYNRAPELAPKHVHRLMAVCFEYYLNQMLSDTEDRARTSADCWKKIFEILDFCGKMLKWEPFVLYKKSYSKDVYWQKIIHIYKLDPFQSTESKQILFCATIVFVLALQDYIGYSKLRSKDGITDTDVILVEALKDMPPEVKRRAHEGAVLEIPHILVNAPVSPDAPNCLLACQSCWQLLHSNDVMKADFAQLILCIPQLSGWVQKFLIDLYVCAGQHEETATLLQASTGNTAMSLLENSVRQFALTLVQGPPTVHLFEQMGTVLKHLPHAPPGGHYLENVSLAQTARVLMLMPLTKRAILHYLVQTLIVLLKPKLIEMECSSSLLGNMLVLSQLNWPHESTTVEIIFELIKTRRQFTYLHFTSYVIQAEIIEEFMHLWTHSPDVKLELAMPQQSLATGARRIGTRGADKGVKEDFKLIIRQQVARSNDDIDELLLQFLQQQHVALAQNVFDK
ncbi:integrator complex subunit 10 [Anopheles arabiensis]|uniref:Integrator complex subunit 10 n=1 Tax=Anopheles arabiensis TaxID=7173 RepID=A0A182HJC9_ANOAR|nr:integrator complex subunit 10 [Anopheles arabiensis]XP_040151465.1 integrator complex subunit 10 [Anopheles arabiensis]